jgi:hypothetical protein
LFILLLGRFSLRPCSFSLPGGWNFSLGWDGGSEVLDIIKRVFQKIVAIETIESFLEDGRSELVDAMISGNLVTLLQQIYQKVLK